MTNDEFYKIANELQAKVHNLMVLFLRERNIVDNKDCFDMAQYVYVNGVRYLYEYNIIPGTKPSDLKKFMKKDLLRLGRLIYDNIINVYVDKYNADYFSE